MINRNIIFCSCQKINIPWQSLQGECCSFMLSHDNLNEPLTKKKRRTSFFQPRGEKCTGSGKLILKIMYMQSEREKERGERGLFISKIKDIFEKVYRLKELAFLTNWKYFLQLYVSSPPANFKTTKK